MAGVPAEVWAFSVSSGASTSGTLGLTTGPSSLPVQCGNGLRSRDPVHRTWAPVGKRLCGEVQRQVKGRTAKIVRPSRRRTALGNDGCSVQDADRHAGFVSERSQESAQVQAPPKRTTGWVALKPVSPQRLGWLLPEAGQSAADGAKPALSARARSRARFSSRSVSGENRTASTNDDATITVTPTMRSASA